MIMKVCLSQKRSVIKLANRYTTTALKRADQHFSSTGEAFVSKSTYDLVRSYLVFSTCQTPLIVNNAETLLKFSYKYFGKVITNAILKVTFFGHFCAGENEQLIKPKVDFLHRNGVGAILDYASESDETNPDSKSPVNLIPTQDQLKLKLQCRIYDYKDEILCDQHYETFHSCIKAVRNVSPTGFAAIKCTALGNPEILKKLSLVLLEVQTVITNYDAKRTIYPSLDSFMDVYLKSQNKTLTSNIDNNNSINIKENVTYGIDDLKVEELSNLITFISQNKLNSTSNSSHQNESLVLTDIEIELFYKMYQRLTQLVTLAKSLNVRLMIDAEHTYFQPAIDYLIRKLSSQFNIDYPVVFGTYQLYLKDSKSRLFRDIKIAENKKYKFAAKLVRGAYLSLERQRAIKLNIPDPIYSTIEETHNNYNQCVKEVIALVHNNTSNNNTSNNNTHMNARENNSDNSLTHTATNNTQHIEIMIASHNEQSVQLALQHMNELNLQPSTTPVYFGQLLGMSDYISFSLGHAGYKVYKYVPYGEVHEVMPYLIRRAVENSDALSGAHTEIRLVRNELFRRVKTMIFKPK